MKLKKIISKLIFILGICLVLFPIISKIISNSSQTTVINNYNKEVLQMPNDDVKELQKKAQNFNDNLYKNNLFDSSLSQDNINSLDFSKVNILAYISIPKISLELPIYEGSSDNVLSLGIGHLSNTSLPVGGVNTHCVLVRSYWSYKFYFI